MSEREITLLLEDMMASIQYILDFTKGYSFEEYEVDSKKKFAVERNFEIIGEAATRIPENFKTANPEVEWRIIKTSGTLSFMNISELIPKLFGIRFSYKCLNF